MKQIIIIIHCLTNLIKKKIFIDKNSNKTQECEKLFDFADKTTPEEDLKWEKEYLDNYNLTTRWQTL